MSSRRLFAAACAGLLTLVVCHQASGGDTEAEFWPELNAFVRLDDTTRLFFLASWTRSAEHPEVDGQLRRPPRRDARALPPSSPAGGGLGARALPVRARRVVGGTLGAGPDQSLEHRGLLEATARVPLPAAFWLVHRGGVEGRDVDGDVSARFTYRLGVEREVTLRGVTMVPYAQAEVCYDTRFGAWNRQKYQAGVEVVLDARWRIEPYYARQDDSRASPEHVNAVGLVLEYFY